jgi:type I restriction enzyme S subunit
MNNTLLLSQFDLLATAPGGVAKLRELILTLAVQGNLVPRDPADEPASGLLKRIAAKAQAGRKNVFKAGAEQKQISSPYALPDEWTWSQLGDIVENMGSGWSPACDDGKRTEGIIRFVVSDRAQQHANAPH